MSSMGDDSREEAILGFSGPEVRVIASAILPAAITAVLSFGP